MPTNIPFGSSLAKTVYGAAAFVETTRRNTFSNRLTGPAPKLGASLPRLGAGGDSPKAQTSAGYPIVRITDLAKEGGDEVTIDLFNILTGKPVMGDATMQGKRMSLKYSTQRIRIDQMRGGVDPGGRMSQQRTVHQLRTVGKAGVVDWWARAQDQLTQVHAAGARGDDDKLDWVVPLSTDPDFASICVNAVKAPSYNRHHYAGDATGIADLDATNVLTLDDIDRLRVINEESDIPQQAVVMEGDQAADDSPLLVLYVSWRQWHWLKAHTQTVPGLSWAELMSQAHQRGPKNPLFTGDAIMWNGILVKRMRRAIRFHQGSSVVVATNADAYTETTATVPTFTGSTPAGQHAVDRAILFGAQSLGQAWGKDSESGTHMKWWEGEEDDGNRLVCSVRGIGGMSKIAFKDANGVHTDHGVRVLDSYAPDPSAVQLTFS